MESYRDLQKSGKDLTTDQKIAVSKYDEVTQCLDFARELFKQVHAISAMWDKDQKKVVRKVSQENKHYLLSIAQNFS